MPIFLITVMLHDVLLVVIEIHANISNYSYAPWCPACKGFTDTWIKFGEWSHSHKNDFKVCKIDFTQNAGKCEVIII